MAERLTVTYHFHSLRERAAERAEGIALEQSAELPRVAIPPEIVASGAVGQVERVAPLDEGTFEARISFAVDSTGSTAAQLLNVLFGNTSLQSDVTLVDAEIPAALLDCFPGPHLGAAGLRTLVGGHGRPLTATALKPMGADVTQLASLCERFARVGIDLIKDDHGIADQAYAPFQARVSACLAATRRAADVTGRGALYVPNLSGGPSALFAQLEFAREAGVKAVMAAPMLLGMPVFDELVHRAGGIAVIAHPALSGSLRIAPAFLFGRLYRLFGADAVIFVNHGGRFGYAESDCLALAQHLGRGWGRLLSSLPMPAGGMTIDRVEEMVRFYGSDVILLISGALYGPDDTLEREGRRFVDAAHAGVAAPRGSASA